MEPSKPIGTFQELEQRDLGIKVVCQRCGHEAVLDANAPALRDRKIAGQRFRCSQVLPSGKTCGGIGLPAIDSKARLWPGRLARHAASLHKKDRA